jgi:membrane protein implicated in regulation of membrane protease activity
MSEVTGWLMTVFARKAIAYPGARSPMVKKRGTVREGGEHTGRIFIDGALWKARSVHGPLQVGQRVTVVGMEGLELLVKPEPEEDPVGRWPPRRAGVFSR